jgi:hypothetical protein
MNFALLAHLNDGPSASPASWHLQDLGKGQRWVSMAIMKIKNLLAVLLGVALLASLTVQPARHDTFQTFKKSHGKTYGAA